MGSGSALLFRLVAAAAAAAADEYDHAHICNDFGFNERTK